MMVQIMLSQNIIENRKKFDGFIFFMTNIVKSLDVFCTGQNEEEILLAEQELLTYCILGTTARDKYNIFVEKYNPTNSVQFYNNISVTMFVGKCPNQEYNLKNYLSFVKQEYDIYTKPDCQANQEYDIYTKPDCQAKHAALANSPSVTSRGLDFFKNNTLNESNTNLGDIRDSTTKKRGRSS